jgi:hypothetical protein
MPKSDNGRVIVIAIGIAVGLVVLVNAVQTMRRTARIEKATKQLKEISLALHNYASANRLFPPGTLATSTSPVPFDTYSGYFVSNKFEPDAAESFVIITDQDQFDKVFGVAMVMGDKSHRLPKDAFKSMVVLAVIKRGKAVWEFKVDGVVAMDGVVELGYTANAKESDSATFASPLIVSIPKGNCKAVEFVENKTSVKKIELLKK